MIPDNACTLRITAAAGTELAGAYSSNTVIVSSLRKGDYNPKAFILHAVLLRQAFAHCGKFPTAASRRSLGRISVPVWLIILSNQLLIVALVGHYPTNKLIRRKLIPRWKFFYLSAYGVLATVSSCYPPPKGRFLRVTHPSATIPTEQARQKSFDLHVLSIPPAFILSQDQTLHDKIIRTDQPYVLSGGQRSFSIRLITKIILCKLAIGQVKHNKQLKR